MPSSIYTPEIASAFGAIDSAAIVDGGAVTSHVLRAGARSMHRLLAKPEPVLSALYDTRVADSEARAMSGPALPWWVQVETWPILAMRGRSSVDARVTLRVASGTILRLQLCSRAAPFSPAPAATGYKTALATGTWETITFDGIPIDPTGDDDLTLYVTADAGSTLGVTGTFGSPNTGTVQEVTGSRMRTTAATTWNLTGNTWTWGHLLVFLSASVLLTTPRLITGVGPVSPQGELSFAPGMEPSEAATMRGATYEIRTIPLWRLGAVTAWTTLRTSL